MRSHCTGGDDRSDRRAGARAGRPTQTWRPPPAAIAAASSMRAAARACGSARCSDWPELLTAVCGAVADALARSASSRMMLADLPPSSCATRFTVTAARCGDLDAGAGRAGERHHVDAGVAAQRGADLGAVAVDEVEHAGGHAGLVAGSRRKSTLTSARPRTASAPSCSRRRAQARPCTRSGSAASSTA